MRSTYRVCSAIGSILLVQALGCGEPGSHSGAGTGGDSSSAAQSEDGGSTQTTAIPTDGAASDAGTAAGDTEYTGSTGDSQTATGDSGVTVTTDEPNTTSDTAATTGTTGDTATTGVADDTGTEGTTGGQCLPECAGAQSDPFADCVISFDPAPGTVEAGGYNHDALPGVVLGPPGGPAAVVSLGCGGQIVLALDEPFIVDGVGPDFIVFENPFNVSFPEPGRIDVSADGCVWSSFPCDPVALTGCAGRSVTKAGPDSGLDPTDPAVAGGDAFDLADVGLELVRYIRIVDVSQAYWSGMGESFCDPGQGGKGGFDLNAISVVHGSE